MLRSTSLSLTLVSTTLAASSSWGWDIRGNAGFEFQQFPSNAIFQPFEKSNVSLSSEIEFFQPVGENGSVTITPFLRVDQQDGERSHADLREFLYTHTADSWELRAGIGKVFWGVAESRNIVDVINQTDQVEGGTTSAKLGQPMLNVQFFKDWGTLDFFVLPGFRESTFAGRDGRPRSPLLIDTDNPIFESSDEEQHIDVALRYSHAIDEWDFGLHGFHGTARDPLFEFDPESGRLRPFYYQSSQIGLDVQATLESWLLKLETIYKAGDAIEDHAEWVTGFEYSFYGINESSADLGVVSEWLYDERGDAQVFQNDILLGLRYVLNDEASTEALLGVIHDLDHGSQTFSLEASTRIGSSVKLTGEFNIWHNGDKDPFFGAFGEEDYVQLDLRYFF